MESCQGLFQKKNITLHCKGQSLGAGLLPRPEPLPTPRGDNDAERWGAKHAPSTEAELCVAKKRVGEIKTWLEGWRRPSAVRGGPPPCRAMLLTGALF